MNNLIIPDLLKKSQAPEEETIEVQEQLQKLYEQLTPEQLQQLLQLDPSQSSQPEQQLQKKQQLQVKPEPGFVVKSHSLETNVWSRKGDKVFINICHSRDVAAPLPREDSEIAEAMQGIDNGYRVPLSLSECKNDRDKNGNSCVVVDCCVHTDSVYARARKDERYRGFLIELCLVWIEQRYGFLLSREYSIPKMKFKGGELSTHVIYRSNANEKISDITKPAADDVKLTGSQKKVIGKVEEMSVCEPRYQLIREPEDNNQPIEFLILTVDLPNLSAFNYSPNKKDGSSRLELSPTRLQLNVKDALYPCKLDLKLPIAIDIDESGAQFDCNSHILTVTMPALLFPSL